MGKKCFYDLGRIEIRFVVIEFIIFVFDKILVKVLLVNIISNIIKVFLLWVLILFFCCLIVG